MNRQTYGINTVYPKSETATFTIVVGTERIVTTYHYVSFTATLNLGPDDDRRTLQCITVGRAWVI